MITIANLAYLAVSWSLLFLIPGLLLTCWATGRFRDIPPFVALTLSFGFAVLAIPALTFYAAAFSQIYVTTPVQVLVSLVLIGLMGRQILPTWRWLASLFGSTGSSGLAVVHLVVLVFALLSFAYQFLFFDVLGFHYDCTYRPCALALGLVDLPGLPSGNASLWYNGHQRIGVTSVLTPPMALYGFLGLRAQWGAIFALLVPCVYVVSRRFQVSRVGAASAALVVAILPSVIESADQNRLVLSTVGLLVLILSLKRIPFLMAGVLAGLVFSMEPVTALGLVGLLLAVGFFRDRSAGSLPFWAAFTLGLTLFLLPVLTRYYLAFGSPFFHEHFSYIPSVPHEFLGVDFTIPAFLNWPFHDRLVRSPFNPLPNLALVPLTMVKHFGVLLFSVVLVGILSPAARRNGKALVALAGFAVPIVAFLALNEDWIEKDKWQIVVMTYVPLYVLFALGVDQILLNFTKPRFLLGMAFLVGALALVLKLLSLADVPEDARFRDYLGYREHGLAAEDPKYLAVERSLLKPVAWLPLTGGEVSRLFLSPELLLPGLESLLEESSRLDMDGRDPSDSMRSGIARGTGRITLPGDQDREAARSRLEGSFKSDPVAWEFDLTTPVHSGLDPDTRASFSRPSCREGARAVDVFPFQAPLLVKVPWLEDPVAVTMNYMDALSVAVLQIDRRPGRARDVPPEDWKEAECLLLHAPPDSRLSVEDSLISMRSYRFSVERNSGDTGYRLKIRVD